MKKKITNYYLPGHSTEMLLTNTSTTQKGRTKLFGRDDSDELSEIMKVGFASCRDANSLYKEIIENLSISFMSKDEMIETLMNESTPFVQHQENNYSNSFNYSEKQNVDSEVMMEVLRLRLTEKLTINSIVAKLKLSKDKISEIFKCV